GQREWKCCCSVPLSQPPHTGPERSLHRSPRNRMSCMNTRTSDLGFHLPHPFIAGASPFGYHVDTIKRLEDAGCAAVVLHSLFEAQITLASRGHIRHRDPLDQEFAAALAEFPAAGEYPPGPQEYARHISAAKAAVRIPVIGSLNGTSAESWLSFPRLIEQAGADALEFNLYEVVTDLDVAGLVVEHQIVDIVKEVKGTLKIPVAVKLSPFFASFGNLARQLDLAGADGLV